MYIVFFFIGIEEFEALQTLNMLCEMSLKAAAAAAGQQMTERVKSFTCSNCNKSYYDKRTLKRHITFQCVGIEPQFQCPHCPKRCKLKSHLQSHIINRH